MVNDFEEMLYYVNQNGYKIFGKIIDGAKLIFEERVKMNCFYCGKYNTNWKCPPRIPSLDYHKMIDEFEHVAFIWVEESLKDRDYDSVRNDSSIHLHKALLECEKWLYLNNNSTALSFTAGSCKLCKNGCAPNHCANPYQSRTPVEALGINVVKSARIFDIDITFPPTEFIMRIGLLLY